VLRVLAAWREEEASERDRPRGHVISDDILVELVRARPTRLDALGSFRGLHPQLVKRCGARIIALVSEALALAEDDCPPPLDRAPQEPAVAIVIDLLDTFLKFRAGLIGIGPSYLATRSELYELVRSHRCGGVTRGTTGSLRVLEGWRRELIGDDLLGLLEGRYSLAIDPDSAGVIVEPRTETSKRSPS